MIRTIWTKSSFKVCSPILVIFCSDKEKGRLLTDRTYSWEMCRKNRPKAAKGFRQMHRYARTRPHGGKVEHEIPSSQRPTLVLFRHWNHAVTLTLGRESKSCLQFYFHRQRNFVFVAVSEVVCAPIILFPRVENIRNNCSIIIYTLRPLFTRTVHVGYCTTECSRTTHVTHRSLASSESCILKFPKICTDIYVHLVIINVLSKQVYEL